jgi:peptide deformylase
MTEEHRDTEVEQQEERAPLDPEARERRRLALALIRTFGDPSLRSKALPVTRFDARLADEVARMAQIMDDAIGLGLAATQLGVMHRVLVYRVGFDAPLVAVVNPELEYHSDDGELGEEGCLSLPGVAVDVDRPIHVRVRAQDEHGDEILIEASGLEARVIQHEMDHLDGVLVLDRTSKEERKEALRILREGSDPLEPRALARGDGGGTEAGSEAVPAG